jgi:flavodoxin
MKLKITDYKTSTYESKAFKGTFSCLFSLQDKETDMEFSFEVRNLVHFDNGKSKWVGYPQKNKKDTQGKWVLDYYYFSVLAHRDEFSSQIIKAVEEFIKGMPIPHDSIRAPQPEQNIPF